ncbi:MAG: hypothetical protein ABL308_03815 [Oceanicaulis sp.]
MTLEAWQMILDFVFSVLLVLALAFVAVRAIDRFSEKKSDDWNSR